jgi:hypothetical protein
VIESEMISVRLLGKLFSYRCEPAHPSGRSAASAGPRWAGRLKGDA